MRNSLEKRHPKKSFFIFGTDTGVGKTRVCEVLIRGFKELGIKAVPFKPLETGGSADEKKSDAFRLSRECGFLSPEEVSPLFFRKPLAPLLASEMEGKRIKRNELNSMMKNMAKKGDLLLVEGAGGVFSPISYKFDWLDLVMDLEGSVIIVIGNKLGAINHAILTENAILHRKIKISGWILNNLTERRDIAQKTNLFLLKKILKSPFLGEIPFSRKSINKNFCKKIAENLINAL